MNRKYQLVALFVAPIAALSAQTNDAARTTIGISVGRQRAELLWNIPTQFVAPVTLPPKVGTSWDPDIWHLRRDVEVAPTVQVRGTRFFGEHLGFVAEFAFYTFKLRDFCNIVQRGRGGEVPNADPELPRVCSAIPGTSQGSSTTMVMQAGMVVRPFSGSVLQPYVEGLAGFASTGSSTAELRSAIGGVAVTIYRDPEWHRFTPTFALGVGVTSQLASGLLARLAVRDTWVSQSTVIDTPDELSANAQIGTTYKRYFSVMIGLDIVLKRQRGKRY